MSHDHHMSRDMKLKQMIGWWRVNDAQNRSESEFCNFHLKFSKINKYVKIITKIKIN